MESELERFHKQNTQLELSIKELTQKLKATDKEMHLEREKVKEILEKFWIQEIFSQKCLKGFINIFFSMLPGAWYQSQTKAVQNRSP